MNHVFLLLLSFQITHKYTQHELLQTEKCPKKTFYLELTDNNIIEKQQKQKMISYPEGFPCE